MKSSSIFVAFLENIYISKQTHVLETRISVADWLGEYKKDSNTLVNPHSFFDNGSFF